MSGQKRKELSDKNNIPGEPKPSSSSGTVPNLKHGDLLKTVSNKQLQALLGKVRCQASPPRFLLVFSLSLFFTFCRFWSHAFHPCSSRASILHRWTFLPATLRSRTTRSLVLAAMSFAICVSRRTRCSKRLFLWTTCPNCASWWWTIASCRQSRSISSNRSSRFLCATISSPRCPDCAI